MTFTNHDEPQPDSHSATSGSAALPRRLDLTSVAPSDLLAPPNTPQPTVGVPRRTILRLGAAGSLGLAVAGFQGLGVPFLTQRGLLSADGAFAAASTIVADALYLEIFPTSPLIVSPFRDPLPVPQALAPTPMSEYSGWSQPPGPGMGQQNSLGNEGHQIWPNQIGCPDPVVYKINVMVGQHAFTTSQVLPINTSGKPTVSFDASGATYPAGTRRSLPLSTIYGFNGTFPGPRINAEYGKPALVRFINQLDQNPLGLDRQDFGAPDLSFLTHLHNGHTAPESDGNPHYSMTRGPLKSGYVPGMWVDNLYLNWPAGNDDREKQSFFWFHDHRMDHTGSNVYKGMVGIYPIYDPKGGMDMGDERQGLRLPGVRKNRPDGAFDVSYDVPLVFFDTRLDDGVTTHLDIHDTNGDFPLAHNPATHPEWWGKTFYKHMPNHGFVGDIFTVNGTAYPVLKVKRRKFTQIASDGGLLPFPVTRDSFELWPAKRREVIIDFTKYQDGTPTTKGDVVYLTNVMKMPDGRMWSNSSRFSPDPNYMVPVLKFVIGDVAVDNSVMPSPLTPLRELPPLPSNWQSLLDNRLVFEVQRGSGGGEIEWLINGTPFTPETVATSLMNPAGNSPLAQQPKNSFNIWEIRNGGGGWVHPFHLHMEEHRTVMRDGKDVTAGSSDHPDDVSREDLVALDPGESVMVYRGFRDFVGPYVAHCHNLAHEDHAMMFGWEITP